MQNINIDRDIFLFELSSYICNRQLRHVLLSSYVRVYVRSTVFLLPIGSLYKLAIMT